MLMKVVPLLLSTAAVAQGQAPVCPDSDGAHCSDRQQQQQQCGLYMARGGSTFGNSKWALFAGKTYVQEQRVGGTDLVIPILDANKNEYSPWHDYVWKDNVLPDNLLENNYQFWQDMLVGGIGAMLSCSSRHANIKFEDKTIRDDPVAEDDKKKPATAGSFTAYHNFGFQSARDLKEGEELFFDCDDVILSDLFRDETSANTKSLEWLEEHGACLDNLSVGPSTLPGSVGRGAFAKRAFHKDEVVTIAPLLHFDRSQVEIVKQQFKTKHVIPIPREHSIEYKSSEVVGTQLMLNYCYGHPDSNVLLLPLAPAVNYINHNTQKPNVFIRWSVKMGDTTKLREEKPVMELFEMGAGKLMMEYVALVDISPGDEIFLDYGQDWTQSWEKHVNEWKKGSTEQNAFRHEIGVPTDFYPTNWMKVDPNYKDDFIANPLQPGWMAPIRWAENAEVVTPWAFRIGLNSRIREVLLDYCNKMGITDIMRHVTTEGNGLEPGQEAHMVVEGDDWYLQRPDSKWRSNLHWFSPGDDKAHDHYLQALSVAGFDNILKSIGEYLGMNGLVVYHVTFIATSWSTKGYLHYDNTNTGTKTYNVIVPLILADDQTPELDLQDWHPDLDEFHQDFKVGRYHYEYDVAGMMGDGAIHGTSAVDYRPKKEMRLCATIYITDVNEQNADGILNHYTQAYPPNDRDLLLSWAGRHWKKDDPTRKLPLPESDHILVREPSATTSE